MGKIREEFKYWLETFRDEMKNKRYPTYGSSALNIEDDLYLDGTEIASSVVEEVDTEEGAIVKANRLLSEIKDPLKKLTVLCNNDIKLEESESIDRQPSNSGIKARVKYNSGGVRRKRGEQGEAAEPDKTYDNIK